MGKNVQHETVTTWDCDLCKAHDVQSDSSPLSSEKLPPGWATVVIVEGVNADVNVAREPSHYPQGFRGNWQITTNDPSVREVEILHICGGCRKEKRWPEKENRTAKAPPSRIPDVIHDVVASVEPSRLSWPRIRLALLWVSTIALAAVIITKLVLSATV